MPGTDIDGPVFNGNGTPILTYSIVAGSATNGTVTLVDANGVAVASNLTGAYVFTPTPNYATNLVGAPFGGPLFGGPGTFQYVLNDSLKNSQPKTVSVNVTPVNDGTAPLALSGALAAGGTLTATLGVDPEGIGIAPVFVWRNNGAVMAGVTGSTYTLTEADVGHTFSASATYTDGQNFAATVTTATTNAAGEVFVKPTALATATTVTASNTLVNMFGTPAINGAFTYGWDTSTDGVTWTPCRQWRDIRPWRDRRGWRIHPHDGELRGQHRGDAACAVPGDPLHQRHRGWHSGPRADRGCWHRHHLRRPRRRCDHTRRGQRLRLCRLRQQHHRRHGR